MDPIRDLNSSLQQYRDASGNLTRHLSWALRQEGPDHQRTHYATAKLHGKIIGTGSGISAHLAKAEGASRALQYLGSIPANDPLFSLK